MRERRLLERYIDRMYTDTARSLIEREREREQSDPDGNNSEISLLE